MPYRIIRAKDAALILPMAPTTPHWGSTLERERETEYVSVGNIRVLSSTQTSILRSCSSPSLSAVSRLSVSATARPDSKHIDHMLVGPAIKDHAPLTDTQPTKALGATKAFDVSIRKPADCGADALAILPAKLAERLQGSWADLDPPLA